MLLLDTEIERSPEVSSTGWEYRIGYRVERSGTNKKGLCLRLQGFILVETIAPKMVQTAADPVPLFTAKTPRTRQEPRQRSFRRPLRLGGGTWVS